MLRRCSVDKAPDILVQNVSKVFRQGDENLHVLRNVNFQAFAGELVMIVGPSGSGKTTLLSAMAGTLGIDAGSIRLFDFELSKNQTRKSLIFAGARSALFFSSFI